MNKLTPYGLSICLALGGCAGLPPQAVFDSLSIDVSSRGSRGASRSISAGGVVHGIHASGRPGGPPMISESRETARPDDLAEIAKLVRDLPDSAAMPLPDADEPGSVIRLEVRFSTGETRQFSRLSDQEFKDPALQRLDKILRSYRAGYW